jgi:hypothetical protein
METKKLSVRLSQHGDYGRVYVNGRLVVGRLPIGVARKIAALAAYRHGLTAYTISHRVKVQ